MTTLRSAETRDLDAISEMHCRAWKATYTGILPVSVSERICTGFFLRFWQRRLSEPGSTRTQLVLRNDEVMGFISFTPGEGTIHGLYLAPEAQGQGFGSLLLEHALGEINGEINKEQGVRAHLWVVEENTRARAFYERRGAVLEVREERDLFGHTLPQIRYAFVA